MEKMDAFWRRGTLNSGPSIKMIVLPNNDKESMKSKVIIVNSFHIKGTVKSQENLMRVLVKT